MTCGASHTRATAGIYCSIRIVPGSVLNPARQCWRERLLDIPCCQSSHSSSSVVLTATSSDWPRSIDSESVRPNSPVEMASNVLAFVLNPTRHSATVSVDIRRYAEGAATQVIRLALLAREVTGSLLHHEPRFGARRRVSTGQVTSNGWSVQKVLNTVHRGENTTRHRRGGFPGVCDLGHADVT
jgi:hypothetical protein